MEFNDAKMNCWNATEPDDCWTNRMSTMLKIEMSVVMKKWMERLFADLEGYFWEWENAA